MPKDNNCYELTPELFYRLVKVSTALLLQDLYDREVIDNLSNELGEIVIEILRLTNEKRRDTL